MARRRPRVVVSSRIIVVNSPARSGGARTSRRTPGRFFFIWTGAKTTSKAPAARSRSIRGPKISGLMSSMVVLRTLTDSVWPIASPLRGRPRKRRVRPRLGARWPTPTPTAERVINGSSPKPSAQLRMAAPVGVMSSSPEEPPTTGLPRSSSAVAGAGRGMGPWRQSPIPRLKGTGEARSSVTPARSRQAAAPTRSRMESSAPTSWKWTFSIGWPWTLASASARALRAAKDRSLTAGGRSAGPMILSRMLK